MFSFIDLFPDFYIDCSQSLTDSIKFFWFTEFLKVFWNKYELREKCSNTELFLVRISGPYLDTFHAVYDF